MEITPQGWFQLEATARLLFFPALPRPVKNINVLKYSWSSDFCSPCRFVIGCPHPGRGASDILPSRRDGFLHALQRGAAGAVSS